MGEEKKEDQPMNLTVKLIEDKGEGTDLASVMSTISTISGSIKEGYTNLSGTFTIDQKRMADSLNYGEQVQYLKRIAENAEVSVKLAEQQRKEALEEAKTERRRFYTTLGVTVILGVLALIIGLKAL